MPPIQRIPRPTMAKLAAEIAELKKERNALALQLETARRALIAAGRPDLLVSPSNGHPGLPAVSETVAGVAQSIDVSLIVEEIRLEAIAESSKDSERLDTLDQLVYLGSAGFAWQQPLSFTGQNLGGRFFQFAAVSPNDVKYLDFHPTKNRVRPLLDAAKGEAWGQKRKVFSPTARNS